MSDQSQLPAPIILLHGGARHISNDRLARMNAGVKEAAIDSYK